MDHQVSRKTEFNDLKLVDQYIPLEDVYVENLYPFSDPNAYATNQQYHYYYTNTNSYQPHYQADTYNSTNNPRPTYEDFKEHSSQHTSTNLTPYLNSNYSSYAEPGAEYVGYHRDQRHAAAYTNGEYYTSLAVPETEQSSHPQQQQQQGEAGVYLGAVGVQRAGEKPPEPYANIIVKAILSTSNNVMQLKDIYSYMIEK